MPFPTGITSLQVRAVTPNMRSTSEILWSCWTTIFICTWTSIHPNIPPPGQDPIRALWRKLTLMFWALIVPELVLTWAVKQWLAAREIEKQYKEDYKWTRTHAHFLGMGGFTLGNIAQDEVLEVPTIPNFTIPAQPKKPKRNVDWNLYCEEMRCYQESRRQFWTDWEQVQKSCSIYAYSSSINKRELQDQDKENYERHEKYGFKLPDPISYLYESPGTLSFYRFKTLVNKSIISFPTTTSAEINDRAKGDFLFKAIAVSHTMWFLVQCGVRGIQGLAITELELVTLALASLNWLTCFFWWGKPLGAQEPVLLHLKGVVSIERSNDDQAAFWDATLNTLRTAPRWLPVTFNAFRASVTYFIQDRRETMEKSESRLPIRLRLVFHCLLYLPFATVVKSLYAIIDTSAIPPGATHVPMFYATNVSSSNLDDHFIYFLLPIIAAAFGGIHCIGWNFAFPTCTEQTLWRVSSVSITVIPLVTGFVWSINRMKELDSKVVLYPALALLVVYVFARLSLLVQALVLLRREPETAYLAVDWLKYVPHVS